MILLANNYLCIFILDLSECVDLSQLLRVFDIQNLCELFWLFGPETKRCTECLRGPCVQNMWRDLVIHLHAFPPFDDLKPSNQPVEVEV